CVWCGSRSKLELDHVYPVRLGGLTVSGNLQTLCLKCNRWKGRDPVVLHRNLATGVMYAHRVHVRSGFIATRRWPACSPAPHDIAGRRQPDPTSRSTVYGKEPAEPDA